MKIKKEILKKVIEELQYQYDNLNDDESLELNGLSLFKEEKKEELDLPEKWYIILNKESGEIIDKLLDTTYYSEDQAKGKIFYSHNSRDEKLGKDRIQKSFFRSIRTDNNDFKAITTEQLKQYIKSLNIEI